MIRALSRACVVGLVCAALTTTQQANATLEEDASAVERTWRGDGMIVKRASATFVEVGRGRVVNLAETLAALRGEADNSNSTQCLTLAAVGPRSLEFTVKPSGATQSTNNSQEIKSRVGVVTVTRCGESRDELSTVVLDTKSGRGAVELVVARGNNFGVSANDALPDREVFRGHPPPDPGRAPPLDVLNTRVQRVADRARGEGAGHVSKSTTRASTEGNGRFGLDLKAGCHRLELLSDPSAIRKNVDIDIEVHNTSTQKLLGKDRSETSDGRIELCFGEDTRVAITFTGAAPQKELIVVDSLFPISEAIPDDFGTRVRGNIGALFHRRRVKQKLGATVLRRVGVSGSTTVPVEVVPGQCYVAAVGITRGEPRIVSLAAKTGSQRSFDDGAITLESALVSFCAGSATTTSLTVDARGNGVAWTLLVWATPGVSNAEVER